jgi:hypothetical protein
MRVIRRNDTPVEARITSVFEGFLMVAPIRARLHLVKRKKRRALSGDAASERMALAGAMARAYTEIDQLRCDDARFG